MRVLGWLGGAVLMAGCVGGVKPCTTQDDCPGGRCDTSIGVCVIDGTGGGGGGGGVGGGGTGGGGGGGGGAGGGTADAGQCVSAPCGATTICVNTASGHTCEPRFTALVWIAPDAGTALGISTSFTPIVDLVANVRNDGGGFPGALQAALPGMGPQALTRVASTNRYTGGSFTGGQLTEGASVGLSVSYDGGSYSLDAGVVVLVDKTVPLPSITIQPEPTRPTTGGWGNAMGWRRDERPYVRVSTTNNDFASATLTMEGFDFLSVAYGGCDTAGLTCPTAGQCACFQLDLSQPALSALTGSFSLAGTVKDQAGNSAALPAQSVGVTRLRWTRAVAAGVSPTIRSAPVVSKDGYIVVAGSSDGTLTALNPDGTNKWTLTPGPIEGGLSIAVINGKEYVGYGTTAGLLEAVNVLNSTDKLPANCSTGSTSYNAGLAVGSFGSVTTFVGMRNSAGGSATRLQLLRALSCDGTAAPAAGGDSYNVTWPVAPAVSGSTIILSGQDGLLRAYSATALPLDMSTMLPGYPVDLASALPGFNGLALRSSGTKVIGGGAGVGQLFQSPIVNPTGTVDGGLDWRIPPVPGFVGGPTVRGNFAYFGYNKPGNALRHVDVMAAAPALATASFATGGPVQAFPVAGDSELYSLSSDGTLYTSDYTPTTSRWTSGFGAPNSLASPTLDCSRPGQGGPGISGRPGTLYLPLGSGNLVSVIVDSRRLDQAADWPKYQRDAYNSGNANSVGEQPNPGCP